MKIHQLNIKQIDLQNIVQKIKNIKITSKLIIKSIIIVLILAFIWGLFSRLMFMFMSRPNFPLPVDASYLIPHEVIETEKYLIQAKSRLATTLMPRVSAPVKKILVESGQIVRMGQPLIILDQSQVAANYSSSYYGAKEAQSNHEYAKQSLQIAESRIQSAKSNWDLAKNKYDRYSKLFQEQLITQTQYDEYKNNLITAENNYKIAQREYQTQQTSINTSNYAAQRMDYQAQSQGAELSFYTIRAPFNGKIGEIYARIGDLVNPSIPLVDITNTSQVEIYINLPTEKLNKIKKDDRIEILNLEQELIGYAKIKFIDTQVNPQTQLTLVKAIFDNKDQKIRNQERAYANLTMSRHLGVTIPLSAIKKIGDQSFIYVVTDAPNGKSKIATQRPVNTKQVNDDEAEIISGVGENELVITSNIVKLQDKQPISIKNK